MYDRIIYVDRRKIPNYIYILKLNNNILILIKIHLYILLLTASHLL